MYCINFSGGMNRTHAQLEKADKIDAFRLDRDFDGDMIVGGVRLHYSWDSAEALMLSIVGGKWWQRIDVDTVENMSRQLFFRCPVCGKRYRYLYFRGRQFACRKCQRLNYFVQQRTKSSCNFAEDGIRYARRKLNFNPPFDFYPAIFPYITPEKPPGMHWKKYEQIMKRYRRYQQKYRAASMAELRAILGKDIDF